MRSFKRRCPTCRRLVTIDFVSYSESCHGYSYTYACDCGQRAAIYGDRRSDIPDELKRAAEFRNRGHKVLKIIEFQRRELPHSAAKTMLRAARLETPELIEGSIWTVYRFEGGRSITYSTVSETYTLVDTDHARSFAEMNELVAQLASG